MPNPTRATEFRPAAEIKPEQKPVRLGDDARQSDAEEALTKLQRLLESGAPSNPRRKLAAPIRPGGEPGRPLAAAGVGPQAPGPAAAMMQARPDARVLNVALLAFAAAVAVVAVSALNGALGPLRRPPSIARVAPPTATPPAIDETVTGSLGPRSPLPKERVEPARAKGEASAGPTAGPNGPAPFDNVLPTGRSGAAGPAANAPPSDDAGRARAEAPPEPRALNSASDRTGSPPPEKRIAMPAPPGTAKAQPAAEAAAEPKAADETSESALAPGLEPPTQQSDNPSGVAELAKPNLGALEAAPLPPIRPAWLGKSAKHEKRAKPHKAAQAAQAAEAPAETPAPQPAEPEAPAAQPSANPLLRLFGDTFK